MLLHGAISKKETNGATYIKQVEGAKVKTIDWVKKAIHHTLTGEPHILPPPHLVMMLVFLVV